MAQSGTLSITAAIGSHQFSTNFSDSGGGVEKHEVALPAGLAGNAAWGASSAVVTLVAGHGLTTADKVALKGAFGRRTGLTISAADATTITVTNTSGAGDALPTASTSDVTVGKEVVITDLAFVGASARFLLMTADQDVTLDIWSAAASLFKQWVAGGDGYYWSYLSGVGAPVSGTVASLKLYNHSLVAANAVLSVLLAT